MPLIPGATAITYELQPEDVGFNIFCRVRGTNAAGFDIGQSNTVGPVVGLGVPPSVTADPEVTVAGDGASVTCSTGTWDGDPAPTYAYQWYSDETPDVAIPLATSATYVIDGGVIVASEIDAWEDAVVAAGGTVSPARKALVDTLIAGLKTDGVWTLLDRLWIFAAENSQSALIDLKAASAATAITEIGPPTFTTDRGYKRGDDGGYLESNYNPTINAVNFALNSGCMFIYDRTSGAADGTQFGGRLINGGVGLSEFLICEGGTTCMMRINDASGGIANANTQGFWLASRTGASTLVHYKNGAVFNAAPTDPTSTIVPNIEFGILAGAGTGATTDELACAGIGGGLTAGQVTALSTRIETYMDAVGAGII